MKKSPPITIHLEGGATLTRPAGNKNGPVTCDRCHATSGPAGVDTLDEFAAWADKHRGEECRP